jgi:type I restriction enzyme M protein
MVEGNAVECVVSLPPQLFCSTGVPAMLWLLRPPAVKSDTNILFIDATTAGTMVDRTRRILTADDIERIFGAVRDWRNRSPDEPYEETAGFSRSVPRYKIQEHGHRLNPRMYIVTSRPAIDLTQAVETVERLRSELRNLYTRAAEIDSLVDSKLTVIDTWIR